MEEAVRLRSDPVQIGPLLPAVGAAGNGFTVTEVVAAALLHPAADVVVAEYVPEAAVVTAPITGFCSVDVKLLGPFQL